MSDGLRNVFTVTEHPLYRKCILHGWLACPSIEALVICFTVLVYFVWWLFLVILSGGLTGNDISGLLLLKSLAFKVTSSLVLS